MTLLRLPSAQTPGLINVVVPKDMAQAGEGFRFKLPDDLFGRAQNSGQLKAILENGAPLPSWLTFLPEAATFVVSSIQESSLPINVTVRLGERSVTIVISE